MNELHPQDKFSIPFFRECPGYREVKSNTVTNSLIIEEDFAGVNLPDRAE